MTSRAGEMHPVDKAFYRLTVLQRDAAWREVEQLRAEIVILRAMLVAAGVVATGDDDHRAVLDRAEHRRPLRGHVDPADDD